MASSLAVLMAHRMASYLVVQWDYALVDQTVQQTAGRRVHQKVVKTAGPTDVRMAHQTDGEKVDRKAYYLADVMVALTDRMLVLLKVDR